MLEDEIMELSYDGALVMPSNYAIMNEEEMTYFEGGFSSIVTDTTKGIRSRLSNLNAACVAGILAGAALGAYLGKVPGALVGVILGAIYLGPVLGYSRAAHHKVEGYIIKYGLKKKCTMTTTWSNILITGISVSV